MDLHEYLESEEGYAKEAANEEQWRQGREAEDGRCPCCGGNLAGGPVSGQRLCCEGCGYCIP